MGERRGAQARVFEQRAGRPPVFAAEHTGEPQVAGSRAVESMVEFPCSLLVEPASDTVGGDRLEELLEVLAEIGLEAAAERDRRKGELRVVAS